MTTPTAKVFVTNFSAHDYSDAERFGASIVPITAGSLNLLNTDRLLTDAIESTKDSTPDDYLLLSGPPLMCSIAMAVWLSRHKRCNLLIFDAKERQYNHRVITGDQVRQGIEHLGQNT